MENRLSSITHLGQEPYIVEWVYKVKFGHQDEFWKIFQKYQIATLNKEKEQGAVLKYEVFRPGLHTSEDRRQPAEMGLALHSYLLSPQGREADQQAAHRAGATLGAKPR